MKRTLERILPLFLWAAAAWAAEPLTGNWQMISQKIGDSATKPLPIGIHIRQAGAKLTFTYVSGREEKVNMTFTVSLDGKSAPIMNMAGAQIGIATLTKSGARYHLVLQSLGKPPEPGTMALSERGYILTCESTANLPDRGSTHIVQVFSREPQ